MRLLGCLGEASLAIYVMHLFVTTASRKGLQVAGLLTEASVITVATAAGIVLPAVAYAMALRLSGRSGLPVLPFVGLGTAGNSSYLQPTPRRIAAKAMPAAAREGR
jgi:predicted naringenin-chalcone synthase